MRQPLSSGAAWRAQWAVIGALILRDMRTRFGRTALGYVIAVAWPLIHMIVLVGTWILVGRLVPIGTNGTVYFATGVMPYILCLYPARMMMLAITENKPMLLFPIVKLIDIVIARAILEMITAFSVLIVFCFLLFLIGIDFMPLHPAEAILATAATVFYSISIGIFSSIIFSIFRLWMAIFIGIMIIQWLASGATFLPSALSSTTQELLSYNPLFHCVEWLRSAYYDGYGDGYLDRGYLIAVSLTFLLLGLVGERAVRGRLMMQ